MVILLVMCLFAFMAGFVDAIVGGGGLIQLPAMFILFPQMSLVQTLASNKTASFLGTSVSAFSFLRSVKTDWKQLAPAIVFAFIGAFSGALLVNYIHKEQFMPVVVITLFLVLLYTIFKKELGLHEQHKNHSKHRSFILFALTGGIIGLYDGLIGPGTGSFLIFAFVVVFGYNFLHASANAKLINCITNISALAFFFVKGSIVWSIALPVGAANMLGSYTGAHVALKKGSGFVRIFFIIVVSVLILKLCYDVWLR